MNMRFDIEPSDIEPVLCIFFDIGAEEYLDNWQRYKIRIVKDFEHGLKTILSVSDLDQLFHDFYHHAENEVGFFEALEKALNTRGFYTYNSDTRFEVYHPENINLQSQEIVDCLADDGEFQSITILIDNIPSKYMSLLRNNLIEHIAEEQRCDIFPPDIRYTVSA